MLGNGTILKEDMVVSVAPVSLENLIISKK
ncbi:hypothetical protein [Leuconostoc suionicum]